MSHTSSSKHRRNPGCGCLITVLVIAAVAYSTVRYFNDRDAYTRGRQAYEQFDCVTAIAHFDRVVSNWRLVDIGGYAALAQQERAECVSFQIGDMKQQAGDLGGALLAYNDFVINYSRSPFINITRNKVEALFSQAEPDILANQGVCSQTDSLLDNDLIPNRDVTLPPLYFACGQVYEVGDAYGEATRMYERFLGDYPDHSLAPDVEAALARSLVAQARAGGAGEIPAPNRSGTTASGATVVAIQNDSPERLRIVFSGPEPRIEELAACSSCTTYTGIGPLFCPEKGPIGRYTLKPGQYDVLVESIGMSGPTPWTGDWSLDSGDEYYSCFFIVTTFR